MVQNAHEVVYGTTLTYKVGAGSATPLAGIKSFGELPQPEASKIEITRVDQVAAFKQYVAGMSEPGSMSLTLGLNEATYATTLALFRQTAAWEVLFPSGAKLSFEGYIDKIGVGGGDGNAEFTVPVRLQVSGAQTFTPAP